jgi:hypothetical protein
MSVVIAFMVYVALSTGVLAATLYAVCDEHDNPFMRGERAASWLRCLGLVAVVALIGLVPTWLGALVGLVCWFGGIMFLFGLGFVRTLVVVVCNAVLGLVTSCAVEWLLLGPWLAAGPVIAVVGLVGWWAWRRAHGPQAPANCPECGAELPGHADLLSCCPDCGADLDLVRREIAWRSTVRRPMPNHEHEQHEQPRGRSPGRPHRPRQRRAAGVGPRRPG